MSAPLLALEDVSKRFGNVNALRAVDMQIEAGRVTCLLGDNGAGKSTLIRILSGVYTPSAGRLFWQGTRLELPSPRAALERGIATVHQDLALIPLLGIWRNFFMGREPTRGRGPLRRIDVNAAQAATRAALAEMGVDVRDVEQPVGTLSGGERQAIAIARAIHFGARVLILDEPTAALGVKQTALVLDYVRRARERGVAVVLITHNPHDAFAVGDDFVVLRQGEVVVRAERGETSADALAAAMR